MPEKQRNLTIRQTECRLRQTLLVGALAEDAELPKPQVHTRRVPPVPVAAHDELVPGPASRVSLDPHSELLCGCLRHREAVLLGGRGVPQRLMCQIAPISHQVAEE